MRPPDQKDAKRLTTAVFELAATDPEVQKLQWEVGNCLKPGSAFEDSGDHRPHSRAYA